MKFAYTAFDAEGRRHEGMLDAPTEPAARAMLVEKRLFVVKCGADTGGARKSGGGRRLPRWRCLAEFTRQTAILVSTGTPLVQALGAVERQMLDPTFAAVVADVRKRVEEGSMLADAMAKHPKYFDAVAKSLVSAGESSGRLSLMLEKLADINRQKEVVRKNITAALAYPVMLLCIACVVLVGMLMFVVPRFAVLFESLDAPVPASTAVLMAISNHLRATWWYEFPTAAVVLVGGVVWLHSAAGRAALDSLALRVPALSSLIMRLAMARIARLLGVLLESRVPLLDALALTQQSMTHHGYAALLGEVSEAVKRGSPISSVVGQSPLFTASFVEAVRSGEDSGQVGQVLLSLAGYLDEDNAVLLKSVTQLLEPLVLIVLGLVIGTVAVSMFLPLFDATAATHVATGGGAG
ncbi:MAG: type II secretion system F family protein [Phycisphaerales bacterium]|nr:type II secretion system F family protein [Phycisphaerales bacterium]